MTGEKQSSSVDVYVKFPVIEGTIGTRNRKKTCVLDFVILKCKLYLTSYLRTMGELLVL